MTERRRAWNSTLPATTKPMARKAMKRSTKRLKSKSKGRTNYAKAYAKENPTCELCKWLSGPRWEEFRGRDFRACTACHVHHVYSTASRWDSADGANYVHCCATAHDFIERYMYCGRLVCTWVKIQNGTFNRETVRARWDRDPIDVIHGDVDGGRMEEGTDWEDFWKLVSESF